MMSVAPWVAHSTTRTESYDGSSEAEVARSLRRGPSGCDGMGSWVERFVEPVVTGEITVRSVIQTTGVAVLGRIRLCCQQTGRTSGLRIVVERSAEDGE